VVFPAFLWYFSCPEGYSFLERTLSMEDLLTPEQILNAQLHAIFQSSSDGILVCDGKGKVLKMNEASEKLNGMSAADVIGKNVAHFVSTGAFDRSVTLEVLETRRQVSIRDIMVEALS
jgi:transcriptional regulator with PAS, ATPase and Fis domain